MDLLRKTTHTTIGIPNRAVMALIGKVNILEMMSQRSNIDAPERIVRAEGHDDRYFGKAFL